MVSASSATGSVGQGATISDTNGRATLGDVASSKDQFLKLLLAQLKYQDPLQPPDASKFGDQMTQFGQLEQLFNVNTTLGKIANQSTRNDISQSVSLIGKNVQAYGDEVEVSETDKGSYGFYLNQPFSEVDVEIQDATGHVVRKIHQYNQNQGPHFFEFDGLADNNTPLNPGVYTMTAKAFTGGGTPISVKTLMQGGVTGVGVSPNGTSIQMGQRTINLDDVVVVQGS